MDNTLEIRLILICRAISSGVTIHRAATWVGEPKGRVRTVVGRLQRDGLVAKDCIRRPLAFDRYRYNDQKTVTFYRLTREGRKFAEEIRND